MKKEHLLPFFGAVFAGIIIGAGIAILLMPLYVFAVLLLFNKFPSFIALTTMTLLPLLILVAAGVFFKKSIVDNKVNFVASALSGLCVFLSALLLIDVATTFAKLSF